VTREDADADADANGDTAAAGDDPGDPVTVDGQTLTPAAVERVARDGASVHVPEAARERVRESRERIEEVLDADEAVYGVNTGFGELVDERIPRDELDELQVNLVRSHASGTGRELDRPEVRALLVTRLNALVAGYSGIRECIVDHLVTMLDAGIHPVVRSRGSLGASGDLAPLAHVTLVLIGEGEADVEAGEQGDTRRLPGDEALAQADLEPLELAPKEGLALINGTQLTVSLASLFVRDAERLLDAADVAGALTTEVTMGSTVPSDPIVAELRPHSGQATSARNVRRLTADSEIVESHRNCDRVQDAYSLRCLPQVHGAARDAIAHLREAVAVELNSATDNPLVVPADDVDPRAAVTEHAAVLSAGNFHGAPLAHRLDYATAALTDLAAIAERRVDRLLNPNLQESHLRPFLATDTGVESGLMIAQYTAATLVNELRSIDRPATDSIPVSGGQEDHVSMSATSAFAARRAVNHARGVVAIELLCAAEAAEAVDDELDHGSGTGQAYDVVRAVVDSLSGDRPLAPDIDALRTLLADGLLVERVGDALPDGFA